MPIKGIPWLPRVHKHAGYRIDGSKVQWWATRKQAEDGARSIGWPMGSVVKVHTRFGQGWALSCSLGTGGLSKDDFRELSKQVDKLSSLEVQPTLTGGRA